jgi:hypothetical protein
MKSRPPLTKIEMIERSMSCFTLGLFGLLPVIGIPMSVMSLAQARRVRRGQGAMWNPAQRYLFWGTLCARAGLWPFLIIAVLVGVAACLFPDAL